MASSYKKCIVSSCKLSYKEKKRSYFELPNDMEQRQRWLDVLCKYTDTKNFCLSRPFICELHFNPEDITRGKRTLLKPHAVPSIFLVSEPGVNMERIVIDADPFADIPGISGLPGPTVSQHKSSQVEIISHKKYNDLRYRVKLLNLQLKRMNQKYLKTKAQLEETKTELMTLKKSCCLSQVKKNNEKFKRQRTGFPIFN